MRKFVIPQLLILVLAIPAWATIFGSVRGLAHDPQHRPVGGAEVTIAATTSSWKQSTITDADGEFIFPTVSIGDYAITVSAAGFAPLEKRVTVTSGSSPEIHFP